VIDRADPYWFDEEAAEFAVSFFPSCLQHIEGVHAGKPFDLLPWQVTVVSDLFGWKRTADNLRRYRAAYIEVPRKNGKSTFAAGLALFLLLLDDEAGAQVYSAASTRDQAGLVYRIAVAMARKCDGIAEAVKIRDSKKRIIYDDTNSFYQVVSSDAAAQFGQGASAIIFDEVHTQPNRELWDALTTSVGARPQPLTIAITTAGHDRSSICWELHEFARKVEADPSCDASFYPVLYGAEASDDWTDPEVWARANPSIGYGVTVDYLATECNRAKQMPSYQNTFRRLHLNQWTEQESRIIPMIEWDECSDAPTDLEDKPCFVGMDLSSTRDVTALVLVFPDGEGAFDVLPYFWIPEESASERARQDKMQVMNYAQQGHIETTPGNEIDTFYLVERIGQILGAHNVKTVGFDVWNSGAIVQMLQRDAGIPLEVFLKMRQNFSTYNQPFKRLLGLLASRKLRHGGNPVLRWMAGNTAHRQDASGNIRPDKGRSSDKIDGISAMLMGLALALNAEVELPSVYEESGQLKL